MADRIQTFIDGVKLVLEREFPDLTGAYRYPIRARVIKVQGAGADIELLDKDGGPSPTPPLPAVPYPVGMELLPGDLVRVGFYYNDPAQAFIEAKI